MFDTQIFISLKQSDLVALSALETIQNILKIEGIESCKRFRVLSFKSQNDLQSAIENKQSQLFFLFNPNKENLSFQSPQLKDNQCAVKISSQYPPKTHPLCPKLQKIFNDENLELQEYSLWLFTGTQGTDIQQSIESILYSKSIHQGLLANPITEKAELLHLQA